MPHAFSIRFLLLSLLLPGMAAASCGLQSCPMPAGSGEVAQLETGLRTRWVAFDISGTEGAYFVMAPRLFLRRWGFAVGAELPVTRLSHGDTVSAGLSNPVLMVQYARRLTHAWSAEVGVQWELPVGDVEKGLAGDHMMLLPWLGARLDLGAAWHVAGQLAYSRALTHEPASAAGGLAKVAHDGEDHGNEDPVLVNPHADEERQWRAAAGWMRGRGTVEGFMLGQTDLTGAEHGNYVRAGASWEWTLARLTALQVIADVPVTAARRADAALGVGVKTGW